MPTIKKLQHIDGVDVTAPADLTSESSTTHIAEYVDDAAFVTANGTAQPGDIYINTTFRCLRIFTGSAWRNHVVSSDASDATKTFEVDVSGNTTNVSSTLQFNDTADAVHDVPAGSNTIAVYPINLASDTSGVLGIAKGGTGQTTASAAINALVPTQSGNIGKFLSTDGTVVSWQDGGSGSGSGSGEINAVLNPSDANAGWTASGSHTVTGLATGSPLDPIIPTGIRITATSSSGESSTSGGGYEITTMPESLYNKKLKLEFYFKTPISTDWAVSIYAGATRIPLSSDVAGVSQLPRNLTDKFVAYFDAKDDVTYSIRWTRIALSGTTSLDLTNVIVGPGIQAVSAIVGPWIPWTPTSPTWGIAAAYSGRYRQVGQNKEYQVRIDFSGATNPGQNCEINLPPGDVISSTNFIGPSVTLGSIKGGGSIYDGGSFVGRVGVSNLSPTVIRLSYTYTADDRFANLNDTSPVTVGAGTIVFVEFEIPIAALDGAGTINIGTPDVEYIYNTNLTDTDNSTSFGYGAEGTQFAAFTAQRFQRVRSKYQIGPTDRMVLELTSTFGDTWTAYEQGSLISPRTIQNSVNYGAFLAPVSATDIDVYFADYRATIGATYGSAGALWSDIDNDPQYRWRVAIYRGPSPVGFSTVTQAQSGLVARAGQLLGTNTNDTAEAGHVGEEISWTLGSAQNISSAFATIGSIVLTAGEWRIRASVVYQPSTNITTITNVVHGISNTNFGFSNVYQLKTGMLRASGGMTTSEALYDNWTSERIKVATTQTWYLNLNVSYSGGQLQLINARLTAERIR